MIAPPTEEALDAVVSACGFLAHVFLRKDAGPTAVAALDADLVADWPLARDADTARGVDLLLPNADELRALTGSQEPEGARELLGTVGAVAVTFGLDGAAWVDDDGIVTAPAETVPCVDSTGAGDAFDAGVLAAWLRGDAPRAVLTAGASLGARAVSQVGAQP